MLVDVMMTMMTRMNPSAFFIGGSSRSNRCISSGSVKAFVTTTTAFSTMTIGSETKRNSANTNTRWTGTRRRTIQVPFYSDGSVFQKAIVGATSSLNHRNLSSSLSNSSNGKPEIVYDKTNMKNLIKSSDSLTAKKVQALLKLRKRREQLQQVVVEGPRIILDLYRNVHTRPYIERVLIDVDQFEQYAEYFQQLHDQFPSIRSSDDDNSCNHKKHDGTDNSERDNESTTKPTIDSKGDTTIQRDRSVLFIPTYRDVLKHCCTDTVNHQGIVAICDIPKHLPLASDRRYHDMYLVCDAIQDPGNIGTLIRSAVACGVKAIFLLPNACDVWNPKAIRSAMGATFSIPIFEMDDWNDCYQKLLHIGCTSTTIYAATMLDSDDDVSSRVSDQAVVVGQEVQKPRSMAHYDVDWIGTSLRRPLEVDDSSTTDASESASTRGMHRQSTASALIIGSEGNGLTGSIRDAIDKDQIQTVYVPMMTTTSPNENKTPAVESLNAAICGSIILFEYLRQKHTHARTIPTDTTAINTDYENQKE